MISLVLADDHPATRAGIRAILSEASDIQIVGEAQDGFEAENLVFRLRPQILLLDLKMPGPRPAEIEKWVRTNCPETATLILTAHDRDAYLATMLDGGASGYITKNESAERLINAIRRAAQGDKLFTEEQYQRVFKWRGLVKNKLESLTNREKEILPLLKEGLDNVKIAERLGVTPKTVAHHLTNIYEKLEMDSRQEVIAWIYTYLSDDLE